MFGIKSILNKINNVKKIFISSLALITLIVLLIGVADFEKNTKKDNVYQEADSWLNGNEKIVLKSNDITVDLPDSGIGAYYTTYIDGIIIKWENPPTGNHYALLLKKGDRELIKFDHASHYGLINFIQMDLSGREVLTARFYEFDLNNNEIQAFPSFDFDLSNPVISEPEVESLRAINPTAPNEYTQYLSGDFTDSDGDGMTDAAELKYGFDPNDSSSFPEEAIVIQNNTEQPDVPIEGSGTGAVYQIIKYQYIKIKWQNPNNGEYKLYLYNGGNTIYAGIHGTEKANISYGSKHLSGSEILSGHFELKGSNGEIIEVFPDFEFNLNNVNFNSTLAPSETLTIGGSENRISYSLIDFTPTVETSYRNFLRRVYPILYDKLGPPAENFNCEIYGKGSLGSFYTDNRGRKIVTNGTFLPQTISHELIHAWKGQYSLTSDANWNLDYNLMGFEEGSAQGMSLGIIREYVKNYPDDEASRTIMSKKNGQYWDSASTSFDMIKQRRYLGAGDLWNGGLQSIRYSVASTIYQIMEVENPYFYRNFMAKYYDKINNNPEFRPSAEGLINLIAEVNPTTNGISTVEYLSHLPIFQGHPLEKGIYVINQSNHYGQSSSHTFTASFADKRGDLFWTVPTESMSEFQIPSWVPTFRNENNKNIINMENQPFTVSVFNNENLLLETKSGNIITQKDSDGSPQDLGFTELKNFGAQSFPTGLYKITTSFDNFVTQDANATESEYIFGLNTLGQDKSNEYIIIICIVGIENGSVNIEINNESLTSYLNNGTAVFRSNTWPFDMEGLFSINVTNSDSGIKQLYYRTIVQAATLDKYYRQQYLIIDRDFDGIEDL